MEENPTLYHASPVCCNFSKAKTMRGADAADRQTVEQLVDVITIAQPPIVTIENVPAYAQTELATAITDALTAAGYKHETVVMDSADFGGIQQRKRMLIRGVLEGELPARPEKQPAGDWYAALEDLIDDAPTSEFRSKDGKENWELKRIRQMAERGSIDPTLPIITMGGSAGHSVANARNSGGPAPTLKATSKEVARIIMPDGRVKRVTPRMMARLMGLPDSYKVPDNPELAKTILGNGMEANFTQQLIGPLISKETPKFSLRQKPQQETPKFSLIPDIPRSVNLQARTDKDPASLGGANIVHNENFPSLQEDEAFFESALGSYIKEWRRSKPPTRDQFPNEKKYLKAHQRYRQEEIHEGLTADQVYDRMIQIAKKRGSRQSEMEVQTLFGNKDHFRQMAQQAGSVFDAMVQPQIPQLVISKIQQNLQYPRLHYAAGENHVTGSERVITISHDNMDVFQPFPREPKKSHYGSENEIGFLMVHDREDFKDVPYGETGDRILQLDQIQSDLINEIRKKGVRTKTDEELVELRDAKAAAEAEPDVRQVQYANDLGDLYQEIAAQLPSGQIPALSDLKREADNELLNTTAYYMNSIIKELNGIMFTFGRNKFPDLDNRMEELKRQYKADQEQLMDQAHAASKTYRQESNAEPDHFLRDTYYRRFLEFFVQLAIEEDYNGFVLPTANQVMTANRTDEDKRAGNELYYDRRYPSHIEKYINYLNEKQGTGIELTREDFNNMGEMMLVGRFQSSTRAERNDSRQAIRSFKPSLVLTEE
jgi:site-specific DNA-cytosine methylase